MNAYLFCDKRSLNDATLYYIGIIHDCLITLGYKYYICHSIDDIKKPDIILTITERFFLIAKLRFPNTKTIYWAQGISAEEAKMTSIGLKGKLRYFFRLFAESLAVKKADILICVSKKMREFYVEKYGYNDRKNNIIIPCYNLNLSSKFSLEQYQQPTFVYAGGISKWQGIDIMLEIYREVEDSIPESKLIICTNNQSEFKNLINAKGIRNFEIKYVPLEDLQEELHKYKYGLIIRDNHIVNQVATPTKMNSYLANYLIPIYSDSVQDFRDNLDLQEFRIMADTPLVVKDIADKIVSFEKSLHDFSAYKQVVEKIFDSHYNDKKYKDLLISNIRQLNISGK